MPKPKPKLKPEPISSPTIPETAVPHLFNAKLLEWQRAQFDALKAIHEKLDEILAALKE